jgi:hypothetical protein
MPLIRALLAAVLLWTATISSAIAAPEGCISRREGRQLVELGLVIPFPEAMRRAGLFRNQVLRVQLCAAGPGFVYRVQVLQPGGRVRAVIIPSN